MIMDWRAPHMSWEKMSWPKEVVPSQWAADGERFGRKGLRARTVGRDQTGHDGEHEEEQQKETADLRLAVA